MKALRNLVTIFILFLLLSVLYVSHVDAQPYWLRRGVYAVYRFEDAYTIKSIGEFGWEFESLGPGVYRWEVIGVEGNIARLNVTLVTKKFSRSLEVTIDTETMDLVEDGRVWGKAWLWIDVARLPPSPPTIKAVRNITVIRSWLGEEFKNPTVSRIHSVTKEGGLKPVRTGLGPVDMIVVLNVRGKRTEITCFIKMLNEGGIVPKTTIHHSPGGVGFAWEYDAKSGLLLSGFYIDDILTQIFNIVKFEAMGGVGEGGYWMYLEDTNVEIGLMEVGFDPIMIIKANFVFILLGILALAFILAFVRERSRWGS